MVRIIFLLVVLCTSSSAFAQAQKYMIDLEVGFLMYRNDSINFKKPKNISISTSGCTDIFSLGKSRMYEFGMKVEILESKLTGTATFIIGKVYYVRTNKNWEEVMKIEHMETEVKPVSVRQKIELDMLGGASLDVPPFDVRLNDNYYLVK